MEECLKKAQAKWIKRLHALPVELQNLIMEDMETVLRARIIVMERVAKSRA